MRLHFATFVFLAVVIKNVWGRSDRKRKLFHRQMKQNDKKCLKSATSNLKFDREQEAKKGHGKSEKTDRGGNITRNKHQQKSKSIPPTSASATHHPTHQPASLYPSHVFWQQTSTPHQSTKGSKLTRKNKFKGSSVKSKLKKLSKQRPSGKSPSRAPSVQPVSTPSQKPSLLPTFIQSTKTLPPSAPPGLQPFSQMPALTTPSTIPSIVTITPSMRPSSAATLPKPAPTESPTLSPVVSNSSCISVESTDVLERLLQSAKGTQLRLCSFDIVFTRQILLVGSVNLTCQGTCVFDGQNATRLFIFGAGVKPAKFEAYFQGFSFQWGRAANGAGNSYPNGGAFAFDGLDMSIARFNNCTFLGNTADARGGAIAFTGTGRLEVVQTLFMGNTATNGGALYGGVGAVLETQGSIYRGNIALGEGRAGAAIYVDGVLNCAGNNTFEGNLGYPNIVGPFTGCDGAGI